MAIMIAADIKQEIAQRVVAQAGAGYHKDAQGEWHVVDGAKVVHLARNAPWKPWNDDAAAISVDDLVWYFGGAKEENADFTDYETDQEGYEIALEFALGYVPDSYDPKEYAAIHGA